MIQFIYYVWYNEEIIKNEMIYKSYRCTVIANNLNRQEVGLFRIWNKMNEKVPLVENDLETDYDNLKENKINLKIEKIQPFTGISK